MEGEVYNFMLVWTAIILSLFYSHTIGKTIPQGTTRLLALAPIVSLFLWLPLNLTTLHLGGLTSFLIAWVANFKLLLFAFGEGPLCASPTTHHHGHDHPPIPFSQFLSMACLPIKALHTQESPSNLGKPSNIVVLKDYPSSQNLEKPSQFETKETMSCYHGGSRKGRKSPLNYTIKVAVFCILLMVYGIEVDMHPHLRMSLYCFHIYFMLELLLGILAVLARTLVRFDLEPQFDEPYLATSLQDFWGRRWNLVATSILRPVVYHPVRYLAETRLMVPRKWAPLPAVFATFLVSGLLHELIFYYIGRLKPTGEITCFFVLHGVCLVIEIVMKKALDRRYQLPRIISRPITSGLVMGTSFWLFFPPFMRFNPDVRGCKETVALFEFVRHGKLVSPYDVSCPFDL